MNSKIEKDFMVNGYRCICVGTEMGHRCGYVAIPTNHFFNGEHYDDLDIDCHGGLTYGASGTDYPVKTEEETFWVGFDCAHYMDGKDFNLIKELTNENMFYSLMSMERMFPSEGTIRTTEYVVEQLKSIVAQLEKYIYEEITIKIIGGN